MLTELDESDGTIDYITLGISNHPWWRNPGIMWTDIKPEDLNLVFEELLEGTEEQRLFPWAVHWRVLAIKVSKKRPKPSTPKDPVDFMKANQSAVIATSEAMGVDLTKIDFSQFREWKGASPCFLKRKN